jgi:hypothetical protein
MRRALQPWRAVTYAIAVALAMCAAVSWAQTPAGGSGPSYPIKPVRWIIPFDPGTSPDVGATRNSTSSSVPRSHAGHA